MKIFIAGYPGPMGGANTEAFDTAKLWREGGIEVEWIPTWGADDRQRERLEAIGCPTHHVQPDELHAVPNLAGSIVVSFCNSRFAAEAHRFRAMGCPIAWSNCMTHLFEHEVRHFREHGLFEAFHFQSDFQRRELLPHLNKFGTPAGHLIHGAFDFSAWDFCPRPHLTGQEFYVGRLSRPDADKWSSNTWPIYNAIPYARKRARLMGVNTATTRKIGHAPGWGEYLEPMQLSAQEFLGSLHCLLPINGGARENWPRVGLEAMAAGVPIVAQNNWGWCEMVDHGETGYLGNDDQELAYYAGKLAHEPRHRHRMAEAARERVEKLACPETLFGQWRELFAALESQGSTYHREACA